MANNLFRTKSLALLLDEAKAEGAGTLKRHLGATSLVLLGIGAIIGAGLFSLTGIVAAENAGPAVTIAFFISAIGCALAGLCYAEFASMIPIAGSAYTYSYATMGEFMAWIIGWDLVLEYAVGAAMVSISWSHYLNSFLNNLGLSLPHSIMASPFEGGIINLPAVFIVAILSLLLARGTQESATVNSIIVALKVTVVLIFIALGFAYINPANYVPYIPANTGEFGHFGWSGILRGAGIIFFAYIGFDAVSTGGLGLGFKTLPYLFTQWGSVLGALAGFMWFSLLFFAGVTSSLAMGTPCMGFLEDEFGWTRKRAAWAFGAAILVLGLPTVLFFNEGVFDEYDYWAGQISLVVFALIEIILFAWVFGIDNGMKEINEGGDIKVPHVFKYIIKYVTPLLLAFVLIRNLPDIIAKLSDFSNPYVTGSRILLLAIWLGVAYLVYLAHQKRTREGRFTNR
jgi:L-asparagine transporter-like permease